MRKTLCLVAWCLAVPVLAAETGGQGYAPGSDANGAGQPKVSSVRMFLWNLGNDRQIVYGSVPMVYKTLGLTDEQMKAIEGLCKQAKVESAAFQKENTPPKGGTQSRTAYQDYYQGIQKKQDELMTRYQARIRDVLTAEQRQILDQIKALADEKKEEDKKLNEEIKRLTEKNQERFEAKLNQLLTAEQKKKLDEIFAAQKGKGAAYPEGVQINVRSSNPTN